MAAVRKQRACEYGERRVGSSSATGEMLLAAVSSPQVSQPGGMTLLLVPVGCPQWFIFPC